MCFQCALFIPLKQCSVVVACPVIYTLLACLYVVSVARRRRFFIRFHITPFVNCSVKECLNIWTVFAFCFFIILLLITTIGEITYNVSNGTLNPAIPCNIVLPFFFYSNQVRFICQTESNMRLQSTVPEHGWYGRAVKCCSNVMAAMTSSTDDVVNSCNLSKPTLWRHAVAYSGGDCATAVNFCTGFVSYVSRLNRKICVPRHMPVKNCLSIITRGQSNLTKSASRGAHSPVRGHPRGSKFVPLNSWGRVSY